MQSTLFAPENLPQLPKPPFLAHYLLESPYLPATFLVLGGLVGFWFLNQSGRGKHGLATLTAGVGLGIAVVLIALQVKTEREILIDRTALLVQLTLKAESVEVAAMLLPDVEVVMLGQSTEITREKLLSRIASDFRRLYGIDGFRILESHAALERATVANPSPGPAAGRTQFHLRVGSSKFGTGLSWWRLVWKREVSGGAWKVARIEALWISGVPEGSNVPFD